MANVNMNTEIIHRNKSAKERTCCCVRVLFYVISFFFFFFFFILYSHCNNNSLLFATYFKKTAVFSSLDREKPRQRRPDARASGKICGRQRNPAKRNRMKTYRMGTDSFTTCTCTMHQRTDNFSGYDVNHTYL